MSSKGRYLVGQKMTNQEIEAIINRFAHGVQAKYAVAVLAAARGKAFAPNTVFRIYDLLRRRLLEVHFFPDPAIFAESIESSIELRAGFSTSRTAQLLDTDRLRGASDESGKYHLAEIIFRAQYPELPPEIFYKQILTLIRMSGPLNRPARYTDELEHRIYVWYCQRFITQLRQDTRVPAEHKRILIDGYEHMIAGSEIRLRQKQRMRAKLEGKQKGARP